MDRQRLQLILSRFPDLRIVVVGDFFLDKYLIIEHALAETSLETGLEAHQVIQTRASPGAAGNVAANLCALDIAVVALTVIGDDGEGYELQRALRRLGADISQIIVSAERVTPTYTKPLLRATTGLTRELNRLDIKNRSPLPPIMESEIVARLRALLPAVQAVVIADQVAERNCGVVTDRVREEIITLASQYPEVLFAADSRERIGLYRNIVIKPNIREATRAIHPGRTENLEADQLLSCGRQLWQRCGKPVFLTMGERGMIVFEGTGQTHIPAISVSEPIDTVGAGDTALAAIAAALAAGASPVEAAEIGALAASITIRQIGTTGTASRAQLVGHLAGASPFA